MLACNCLNIKIEYEGNLQKASSDILQLTVEEKNDEFFKQCPLQIKRLIDVKEAHTVLIRPRCVGKWVIKECVNCGNDTHAISKKDGIYLVLVCAKLLDKRSIDMVKASKLYSQIFNVVVTPSDIEFDDLNIEAYQNKESEDIAKSLSEYVSNYLRDEHVSMINRIRKFQEQQNEMLNTMKDKAIREKDVLIKVACSAIAKQSTNGDKLPPEKLVLTNETETAGNLSKAEQVKTSERQNVIPALKKDRTLLDEDLIFDFESEEYSSSHSEEKVTTAMIDDTEEAEAAEDVEACADVDEGIQIQRKKSFRNSIAKSLPLNIIAQPRSRSRSSNEGDNKQMSGENVDIAASIKALARSVHGDTIFGELPRPRFSTQI